MTRAVSSSDVGALRPLLDAPTTVISSNRSKEIRYDYDAGVDKFVLRDGQSFAAKDANLSLADTGAALGALAGMGKDDKEKWELQNDLMRLEQKIRLMDLR